MTQEGNELVPVIQAEHDRFWLSLREPGCVPDLKGPWPTRQTAKVLREFIAARPTAYIDVITLDCWGHPHIQHGPEVLQMTDGRSMGTGHKHNVRVRQAEATRTSSTAELLEALERAEALLERYHSFEDLECCATEDVEYRDRLFEREHVRTALAKFGGGQ